MRTFILCMILAATSISSSAQKPPSRRAAAAKSPAKTEAPAPQAPAMAQESDEAVQARQARAHQMLDDIAKMRNILDQMDRNKTFAAPGETPLKHQFDLEIDLWRTLLDDLQAQANSMAAPAAATPK